MEQLLYLAYLCSLYMIIGLSCFIGLQATGFINFFYGMMLVAGFYIAYYFHRVLLFNSYISISIALICCFFIGLLYSRFIDRKYAYNDKLQTRNLLISLGFYIIFQNIVSLLFGDSTKVILSNESISAVRIQGQSILPIYIWSTSVAFFVVLFYFLILNYTQKGLIFRALCNNRNLGEMIGLKSNSVIAFFVGLSYCSMGIVGILIGADTGISPTIGMQSMLMGIVAVIIGGRNRMIGVIAGSIIVSTLQVLSAWYISDDWKDLNTFILLIAFLLLKPNGIIGQTEG